MNISLACDHAGFDLAMQIKDALEKRHELYFIGTNNKESTHYPFYAVLATLPVCENP